MSHNELVEQSASSNHIKIASSIWEALDSSQIWEPWSQNKDIQTKSRVKIWKLADYIVPGHGDIFKVDKTVNL